MSHSTDYSTEDYEVIAHHNGDFSGDVTFRYRFKFEEGVEQEEVSIPFEVIKNLVLYYYQGEKIRKLESWNNIEELEAILGLK